MFTPTNRIATFIVAIQLVIGSFAGFIGVVDLIGADVW
jgi:hypothetical protein